MADRPDIDSAVDRMTQPKMLRAVGVRLTLGKLRDYLADDERVDRIAAGATSEGQGVLVLTDRRLLFARYAVTRTEIVDFPLEAVSSVGWSAGLVVGKITVFVAGNASDITNVWKRDGKAMVDAVRDRLDAKERPPREQG